MQERLEKIETQVGRRESVGAVGKHQELEERSQMIMDVVENVSAEVEKADKAERRAIEAVRQLGKEIVHGWAQRQQEKKEGECDQREKFSRKEETLHWFTVFGKNPDRRANLSAGSSRPFVRPFNESAELKCPGKHARSFQVRGGKSVAPEQISILIDGRSTVEA